MRHGVPSWKRVHGWKTVHGTIEKEEAECVRHGVHGRKSSRAEKGSQYNGKKSKGACHTLCVRHMWRSQSACIREFTVRKEFTVGKEFMVEKKFTFKKSLL